MWLRGSIGRRESESVPRFGRSLKLVCYRVDSETRGFAVEDRGRVKIREGKPTGFPGWGGQKFQVESASGDWQLTQRVGVREEAWMYRQSPQGREAEEDRLLQVVPTGK